MRTEKIEVIDRLEDISIVLFWEIMTKRDVNLLDKNYVSDKEYTPEQLDLLYQTWLNLYDRFFELKDDEKAKRHLSAGVESFVASSTMYAITSTINLIEWLVSVKASLPAEIYNSKLAEAYKLITEANPLIKIDYMAEEDENIKVINRFLDAMQNKHNRHKSEMSKNHSNTIANIYEVVAIVSKVLGMQLNVKDMNVMEWLSYEKMANKMMAHNQKELFKTKQNGR